MNLTKRAKIGAGIALASIIAVGGTGVAMNADKIKKSYDTITAPAVEEKEALPEAAPAAPQVTVDNGTKKLPG